MKGNIYTEIDWNAPEDEHVIELVKAVVDNPTPRRRRWTLEAERNLHWIRGEQDWEITYTDDSETDGRIERIQVGDLPIQLRYPVRVPILRRFLESWLGMIVSDRMTLAAFPQTSDTEDVTAAKLQTQVLQYYWTQGTKDGFQQTLEALWLVWVTGVAFLRVAWDAYAGEVTPIQPSDVGQRDTQGFLAHLAAKLRRRPQQVKLSSDGTYPLQQGEPLIEMVSGFDVFEPPGTEDLRCPAFLIHRRLRSASWLSGRFGLNPSDYTAASASEIASETGMGTFVREEQEALDGELRTDMYRTYEVWVPGGPASPARLGRWVLMVEDKVVRSEPHPYRHMRVPLVPIVQSVDPLLSRPTILMSEMIGTQRALNRVRSEQVNHHTEAIKTRYIAERGHGIGKDALQVDSGIIEVGDGALTEGRFQPLVTPGLPSESHTLNAALRTDMEDVMAMHRSSTGRREHSNQSGLHAQVMAEGDQRAHDTTRRLLRCSLQEVARQMLWLIYEMVTVERKALIVGDKRSRQLFGFKGHDLSRNEPFAPYSWNILVDLSVRADATTAMQQIEAMTKLGYMSAQNPEDVAIVRRVAADHISSAFMDREESDRANAEIENRTFAAPGFFALLPVSDGDMDGVHIEVHRDFQQTQTYHVAVEANPALDLVMEHHVRAHEHSRARKLVRPRLTLERTELEMRMQLGLMPGQTGGPPPSAGSAGQPRIATG